MKLARSAALPTVAAVVCLSIVSGCTSILETSMLDIDATATCLNKAGAYFLPKKLVKVTVKGEDKTGGKLRGFGLEVADDLISIADREQAYCLDYLGSLTSRDEVGIVRNTEGLLQRIYTRAEDKTVAIAKTLIDTGFLGAGTLGRVSVGGTDDVLGGGPFTFDPFDPVEAAKINAALRPFGYCVFVEGFSFPYGVLPSTWCEQPRILSIHVTKAPPLSDPLPPHEVSQRGVLYRPEITRTLTVLRKADPYGRDPWRLTMTKKIEVPNRAPVFVVEVNRSLFVDRVTDLEFKDGVLTNISIKKPSEAAAFVDIPLAVASAVVALPGLVIKLKINEANNRLRLIQAQTELIAVRRQHFEAIEALVQKHGNPGLAGLNVSPSGLAARETFIRQCMATQQPVDVCEQRWQLVGQ